MKERRDEKISQSQELRNNGVLKSWIQRWAWASYANHNQIFNELVEQKKPWTLEKFHDSHKGEPTIIIGAGKSADELWPVLSDWKGDIFTSESMAKTCAYYGHKPEYVLTFDCHEGVWQNFLKDFDWKGSTLITHPCASVEMIEKWTEEKIYYLMMHFSHLHKEIEGNTLAEKEANAKDQLLGYDFFETVQPTAYNFIPAQILNAGCVVNNAIQVAKFMGYSPIFLSGVDFGFKDWVSRTDAWNLIDGEWVCKPAGVYKHKVKYKTIGDTELGRDVVYGMNGIPSTEEQIEYKNAMLSVYKLDRPQLIDCSDGIITELPKADIKEVVRNVGRGYEKIYRTNEEIIRIADTYLHQR